LSNYQYTTDPRMGELESPTIGIRAWFKVVFDFCSKIKVVKIVF
jgi:hypothetical protein